MKSLKLMGFMTAAAVMSAGMAMTSFAGWSQNGEKWQYYNDRNGQLVRNDWVSYEGLYYYMDSNGYMMKNAFVEDSYYVNDSGVMVANQWVEMTDGWDYERVWRYFGSNGRAYTNGWKEIDGVKYYFSDTIMETGWQDIDGRTYYLGDSGVMSTEWRQLPDRDGDWGNSWYYFGSNGRMVSGGENTISGKKYCFDNEGRMLTGWVNISDYTSSGRDDLNDNNMSELRYYRSGGQAAEEWHYIYSPDYEDENWYYFRDGRAYTNSYKSTDIGNGYGLAKIKGETYCFDSKGRMITGLLELPDDRKYYFDDEDGRMRTGRIVVNNDKYDNVTFYFNTSGSVGSKGDGYTGVKNGSLYDNGQLVTAEEGMRYEKVTVDGKTYVVNENGTVKTGGTVTDGDGVKYEIKKNDDGGYDVKVL